MRLIKGTHSAVLAKIINPYWNLANFKTTNASNILCKFEQIWMCSFCDIYISKSVIKRNQESIKLDFKVWRSFPFDWPTFMSKIFTRLTGLIAFCNTLTKLIIFTWNISKRYGFKRIIEIFNVKSHEIQIF